jgi:hypothetical protein
MKARNHSRFSSFRRKPESLTQLDCHSGASWSLFDGNQIPAFAGMTGLGDGEPAFAGMMCGRPRNGINVPYWCYYPSVKETAHERD